MTRDWVNLTWSEKTWWERVQTLICFVFAFVTVFGGAFLVIVFFLGPMIDGVTQYREEHDRCLKRATNGYEIKQCR